MTVLKEEIQYFLLSNNVDHNFSVFHSSVINQQFDLKIAWKKIFSLFLIQDNVDKIKLTKKSEILFYIPLIQFSLPLYLFFLVYSSQFRLHSVYSLSIQKAWLQNDQNFKMADRVHKLRRKSSQKSPKDNKRKRFDFKASLKNEKKEIKEIEERYQDVSFDFYNFIRVNWL